jgi:chromosome segregation ATPase
MARQAMISDEELLKLLKDYFIEKCDGDPNYLKMSEAAIYIQKHGYPKYNYESLRKNTCAKNYFKQLKDQGLNSSIKTLASYRTLDVEQFIARNNTKAKMIAALTQLDSYYLDVTKTALEFYEENAHLKQSLNDAHRKSKQSQKELENCKEKMSELKQDIRDLKEKLKSAMDYIDNVVYEGFAYTLINERRISVKKPEAIEDIPKENFKKNIIRSDMDIIDFMAQAFEEE